MALSSMTGFARSHGTSGPYAFEWELKSVNAKGFDFRMRLPPGWDDIEAATRKRAAELLSRGTVYANLSVKRTGAVSTVRINDEILASVLKVAAEISARTDAVAPSVDGLLAIKGVIEVVERLGEDTLVAPGIGAVVEDVEVVGQELQRRVVIGDGAIVVVQGGIADAAPADGIRKCRVDLDGTREIDDGQVGLVLALVGEAAIGVGNREARVEDYGMVEGSQRAVVAAGL